MESCVNLPTFLDGFGCPVFICKQNTLRFVLILNFPWMDLYRMHSSGAYFCHSTVWFLDSASMMHLASVHSSYCCAASPYLVQVSRSVVSDSLRPHGLQHARLPCPSPTPGACSNSCPSSWWCHPTIWSSVIPFSSRLQSFPASGSFPVSQFFTSGVQSIGVSTSALVLPMNIWDIL